MVCYCIDKQGIVTMKTGDLSDKRAFLSDNSKNNCVLLLCYSRVFITFAPGYCFLRENGNSCNTLLIYNTLCIVAILLSNKKITRCTDNKVFLVGHLQLISHSVFFLFSCLLLVFISPIFPIFSFLLPSLLFLLAKRKKSMGLYLRS